MPFWKSKSNFFGNLLGAKKCNYNHLAVLTHLLANTSETAVYGFSKFQSLN
jgi:hypothetical protein